jgi:hypothetical protein
MAPIVLELTMTTPDRDPGANPIKARGIIFSGPMVRAILEGRKTMTRRVIKPQPYEASQASLYAGHLCWEPKKYSYGPIFLDREDQLFKSCPHGQPGDRLWVRETFALLDDDFRAPMGPPSELQECQIVYKATDFAADHFDCWRPSIHMPRWASRLTLEITNVRVERVQDISKSDIYAEGITHCPTVGCPSCTCELNMFQHEWHETYGLKGFTWKSNPWVWVIEFKRINP